MGKAAGAAESRSVPTDGVLDMETKVVTGLTAYGPGYIAEDLKDLEKVVGLQTDKPSETCISCHTAESKWLSRHAKCTATR